MAHTVGKLASFAYTFSDESQDVTDVSPLQGSQEQSPSECPEFSIFPNCEDELQSEGPGEGAAGSENTKWSAEHRRGWAIGAACPGL